MQREFYLMIKQVKIVLEKDVRLPIYSTVGAAGMDIYSNEDVMIKPKEFAMIDTGISVKIPEGYEIQVRSRSGLAAKYGLFVLNSPGTLDSDYIGFIKVILANFGRDPYKVTKDDRIAQLVMNKVEKIRFKKVDKLENTKRGKGGFGSTGK
jgi:dUTP pyrophosphatase